jgi:wyosine [tRNA(Phe)-imidazoG37] synthetase (radical SAM superfamily)
LTHPFRHTAVSPDPTKPLIQRESLSPSPSSTASRRLTPEDHDRGSAGLLYVYPVVSRRAGGVSIGINLNVNNACNWRCIYCQVPGLSRGAPPPVDLPRLRAELEGFLGEVLQGDFLQRRVEPDARRLNDIALSGNGEPTSAREFEQVVDLLGEVRRAAGVPGAVKTVLITNGSLMHRAGVRRGVAKLRASNGEVWFKLDRATGPGMREVNGAPGGLARVRENLRICAALCPTWVQTCMFRLDQQAPAAAELEAYLGFLSDLKASGTRIEGVLLYSLARPSLQEEATRLEPVTGQWLEELAQRIRALGLEVRVTP